MNEKIKYAPVYIPTLNRFEHFQRCIDSLEHCSGADKTEVYVGLDYPPSEQYVDGWKKIDAYLTEKEKKHCFKNLFVRRRDHNCGVGNPNSNGALLIKEIERKYDRFIGTEDDNEFSPNFLEYMNKALEKYKDEPRVRFICAYSPPEFQGLTHNNIFCSIDVPAYGLGRWIEKDKEVSLKNYNDVDKLLKKSFIRLIAFFCTSPALVAMAIDMINKKVNWGDVRMGIANMSDKTYAICPTVSLVRNWGCDGSGLHSGVVLGIEHLSISSENHFEIDEIDLELPKKYKKRLRTRNINSKGLNRYLDYLRLLVRVVKYYFSIK